MSRRVKIKRSGLGLLFSVAGTTIGYTMTSLTSIRLFNSEEIFENSLYKMVSNKVRNPKKHPRERSKDPNDLFLSNRKQEEALEGIIERMKRPEKRYKTEIALKKYYSWKNAIYASFLAMAGELINQNIKILFPNNTGVAHYSSLIRAPFLVYSYYAFNGAFDSIPGPETKQKLKRDMPLLVVTRLIVNYVQVNIQNTYRKVNEKNFEQFKNLKPDELNPKAFKRVGVHMLGVKYGLSFVWALLLISLYEERIKLY